MIAFLSALRQKLFKHQISVTTVIPGYMNTKPFRDGNFNCPSFLIAEPKKSCTKIEKSNRKKQRNYLYKFLLENNNGDCKVNSRKTF